MSKKYTTITTNDTLHLMCVNPCDECKLAKTFKDINNVSSNVTRTPDNVLVLGLRAHDDQDNTLFLMSTINELSKQICGMCQERQK